MPRLVGFLRGRSLEMIEAKEVGCPAIVIQKSAGRSAEEIIGNEKGFEGCKPIAGIGAALGDSRIGGQKAMQRAWRDVVVGACHLVGPAPAAVEEKDAR